MDIKATIDLDKIFTGSDWDTTVAEIIADELKFAIKSEIRKSIKEDPLLKETIAKLKKVAGQRILEAANAL